MRLVYQVSALFLSVVLAVLPVSAAEWIVTTQAELEAANTSGTNGDIITVEEGTLSISSTVTLTKHFTLRGRGNSRSNDVSTIQVNTSGNSPGILWRLATDGPTRMTGLHIDCNGHSGVFYDNQNSGTAAMTDNRVDHCSFINAGTATGTSFHALKAAGYVYGVADHNLWMDSVIPFEFDDRDSAAWARSPYPGIGTTNCWTLEDNVFDMTNLVDMVFYTSNGARLIFRNNAVTNWLTPGTAIIMDAHGNNELVEEDGLRGTIFNQVYNNTFYGRISSDLRGGHMLYFSNSFPTQPFPNSIFVLKEEEFCRPDLIGPGYTPYPAGDMITNSFFWNNFSGETTIVPSFFCDEPNPSGDALTENIDYWLRAPQSGDSANVFPLPLLEYPHPRVQSDGGESGGESSGASDVNVTELRIGTIEVVP